MRFGSIRETQETLDFATDHNVTADIKLLAAPQINETFARALTSDVRYRFAGAAHPAPTA